MSIINDALKKAQNNLKETNKEKKPDIYKKLSEKQQDHSSQAAPPTKIPPATAPIIENVPVKTNKSWNATFVSLIAIFSIFIGVFVSFLIVLMNQSLRETISSPTVQKAAPTATIKEKSRTKAADKKPSQNATSKNDGLVLSGTMMMGEKRVALIDNEIYELGEYIEGKKITEITLKNVILTADSGEKTYLDVRRRRR